MTRSSKSLSLYPAKSPKSGFANGFLVGSLWVKQEIYDAVFRPAGAGWLPVLGPKGDKELAGIVQLRATETVHVETDSLTASRCEKCGRVKYRGDDEGFGPTLLGATGGFVESVEWFGHIRSAGHRWFISQELYQQVKACKGVNFMPCESVC
jgi:hypothetical protein